MGFLAENCRNGALAVSTLANNFCVRIVLEKAQKPSARQWFVVDY
jgi:hypothetical protein